MIKEQIIAIENLESAFELIGNGNLANAVQKLSRALDEIKQINPTNSDSALNLIIKCYHLAEKSTPANLRRAIVNAENMLNGKDFEPYNEKES